ncbi:MAG: diadenylate cyclase CdaA [Desulfuromonadales bacterium]|nr:diadenylate cyclase CdaA [Desulfuromonas sp. KJ2020]MDW7644180.1 diadenylate cyclase CdaA [Desulfuromonadales bacterium]MDW7758753.1 diadenylate cyclase CdaA [Desulfuromonadales bacterium]
MGDMLEGFKNFRWLLDLLDIVLVAYIIYRIILLIKGTRAVQMLLGLAVILLVYVASQIGGLYTLHWLLDNFLSSIILVIVVIFQNDIRRALIHVGRNPFFADLSYKEETEVMEELIKATLNLANRRIGALIVIERETGLKDFLEVGVEIDAKVSSDLITSIFLPYSPIHDGALVIQQGRLKRAGCFLPLSQNPDISKTLGTRHRAAIGLTELVDAVAIVVSEETGKISVVVGGRITRDLDSTALKRVLKRLLEPKTNKKKS